MTTSSECPICFEKYEKLDFDCNECFSKTEYENNYKLTLECCKQNICKDCLTECGQASKIFDMSIL